MLGKLATMCIVVLLLAGILIAAWGTFGMTSPLTLSIGSGSIALVQGGPVVTTQGATAPATLPVASTAGTALVYVASAQAPVSSMPTGFSLALRSSDAGPNEYLDVWLYLNNPGGISAVTGTGTVGSMRAELSEWKNVAFASALETSGTGSSVGGTTLALATSAGLVNAGDMVIAGWSQRLVGAGAVTFTSPASFTRLADNGSDATTSHHLDLEYWLTPVLGPPINVTLTSDGTTNPASAGAILVLKAAPAAVDMTAFLKYD